MNAQMGKFTGNLITVPSMLLNYSLSVYFGMSSPLKLISFLLKNIKTSHAYTGILICHLTKVSVPSES